MTFSPTIFDSHIAALDEANLVEAFAERRHKRPNVGRAAVEESDHRDRRLLWAAGARLKDDCAGEKHSELAPPLSITSPSIVGDERQPQGQSMSRYEAVERADRLAAPSQ